MTKSADTWVLVYEEPESTRRRRRPTSEAEPGIIDVHSGSERIGSDGRAYSEW